MFTHTFLIVTALLHITDALLSHPTSQIVQQSVNNNNYYSLAQIKLPFLQNHHRQRYSLREQQLYANKNIIGSYDNIVEDDNEEEQEYARKKAEAEKAIAAAEEARQKLQAKKISSQEVSLQRKMPTRRRTKERTNLIRSKISRSDAGTLQIEISPDGVGSSTLFSGAFSVAWFSAILPATFASGGAGALFMLPFWAAGGLVAKTAVVDPFLSGKLTIGQYAWSLESNYIAGTTVKKKEGPTEQLQGCNVELVAIVNGVPQHELRLFSTKKGGISLGIGLPKEELDYLADEINEFLSNLPEEKDGSIDPLF
mmetsp:Transcript_28746/g.40328  ORF Transcript_28746/g.40328 Transcript_28746/m.40328 type:complete len:311 (+) Transcript_28746:249-1181(+)